LETLELESATADDLYEAMDWLFARQSRIEDRLAKRHLSGGTLVLYDVSSTYFEGRSCPLARLGHSRDERSGNLQIVFGLLANAEGCPVAVEVFEGNTGDPKTVAAQVAKLRKRFKLERIILVGDRGMLTNARIREDLQPEGIDWITALRAPQIQALVTAGALQLSLFDERDLAEISHPDYPGERLIACRNPLLAADRARKREELLAATEKELAKIQAQTQRPRKPLRGKDAIGIAVGKVIGRYKVGKHFDIVIEDADFRFQRKQAQIDAEAALDGIYVIRTSVKTEVASAEQTVFHYKSLSTVERAFRSMKSVDLKVRPIHHHLANRVRAHVFLCMLAYYVEWHMRRALAPILFDDHDRPTAQAERKSIVAPAVRSLKALQKAHSKQTDDGAPVHSFQTLIADLATIAKNTVVMKKNVMQIVTTPTALQQPAFDLLQVALR
jgi:transposase